MAQVARDDARRRCGSNPRAARRNTEQDGARTPANPHGNHREDRRFHGAHDAPVLRRGCRGGVGARGRVVLLDRNAGRYVRGRLHDPHGAHSLAAGRRWVTGQLGLDQAGLEIAEARDLCASIAGPIRAPAGDHVIAMLLAQSEPKPTPSDRIRVERIGAVPASGRRLARRTPRCGLAVTARRQNQDQRHQSPHPQSLYCTCDLPVT